MKLWLRIVLFLTGAAIFFFGWYKAHNQMVNLQNPASTNSVGSAEILVVIGGFVLLAAFAPSTETLGRWMALKKPKKAQPAHFRRRRQRG
jgi:metal-dependent hydrolase (beta-lactamase superfamily II)